MSFREFLLSEKRSVRILRHLAFWTFWGFYFFIGRYLNPVNLKQNGHLPNFFHTLGEAYLWLTPQAFLVYPLIYFILPRYVFRGRYVAGFIFSIIFLLLSLAIHFPFLLFVNGYDPINPLTSDWLSLDKKTIYAIYLGYLGGLQGAPTGAALAASFKMFKHYYLKDLRNQQLQKENTDARHLTPIGGVFQFGQSHYHLHSSPSKAEPDNVSTEILLLGY